MAKKTETPLDAARRQRDDLANELTDKRHRLTKIEKAIKDSTNYLFNLRAARGEKLVAGEDVADLSAEIATLVNEEMARADEIDALKRWITNAEKRLPLLEADITRLDKAERQPEIESTALEIDDLTAARCAKIRKFQHLTRGYTLDELNRIVYTVSNRAGGILTWPIVIQNTEKIYVTGKREPDAPIDRGAGTQQAKHYHHLGGHPEIFHSGGDAVFGPRAEPGALC